MSTSLIVERKYVNDKAVPLLEFFGELTPR